MVAPMNTTVGINVTEFGPDENDPAYSQNINSVLFALALNSIIGAACLVGFLIFRTFMPQYQLRAHLNYITLKPPPLPTKGLGLVFGWIKPVIMTPDKWLLRSAGLDALVLQKSQALCIQLFLPVAVIGCVLLIPLQRYSAIQTGDTTFSQLTMANVGFGSKIMWAHWVCVFAFLGWTMLLLEWHFREYVSLRQLYLRGGDTWNYWRELHMAEADGVGVHQKLKFAEVVETARMDSIMQIMDKHRAQKPKSWWRTRMAWLTSWTGIDSAEAVVAEAQSVAPSLANDPVLHRLRSRTRSGRLSYTPSAGGISGGGSILPEGPIAEGVEEEREDNRKEDTPPPVPEIGREVSSMAAPKWWSSVDVLTTDDGKMRKMTQEEVEETKGHHLLLAKPSVRYRKTVNTYDHAGRPVAVHAQQYAVLVTNVDQPVFPEYSGANPVLGAGTCGAPRVKYEGDQVWLGSRYERFAKALKTAKVLGDKGALEALEAAEAMAALEDLEMGVMETSPPMEERPPSSVPPGRAAELWARARVAMKEGRIKKLLRNEQYCVVSAIFSALFPGDFDRVVPVFNFRETDLLMRQWDARLGQLELVEHALRLGGKRKMIKPPGSRVKVDKLLWLKAEVARLERAVLESRERALVFNSTPSFFVLFRTQKAAAIASSCNIHPLRKEIFKVHPAPGPEEVNWEALWFTNSQRVYRAFITTPLIITLVLVPVSMLTSAMTQLNNGFCEDRKSPIYWEDYCTSQAPIFKIIKSAVTGFLPALLIQLWQALLMPRLVFLVAQSEGRHYSLSELDRRMGGIYFMWAGFNFFGGGVVGSAAVSKVSYLVNQPFKTPQVLGSVLPSSAKFFFIYLILRTLMTIPLRFLIPQPGVWQAWIRMALRPFMKEMGDKGAAERTLFMRNAIRSPRYGVEYGGNTCLVILISFAFAVICPLMPLFGVAFFTGQWFFWRYQLIYGYQRKYESGGQMFPFVADAIMISAAVMVAFTGCVMFVKLAVAQATLMWVVGFVSLYAYFRRTRDLYIHGMREMPLLVAQMAPRARIPSTVYVPSPLQQNGWLWYPEFNRVWDWLGMPGYSW